ARKHRHLAEQLSPARLAAQPIDAAIAGGRRDPAARIRRQAVTWPSGERDRERLLNRILGDVDVPEGADQGCDRAAELLTEYPADIGLAELYAGVRPSQLATRRASRRRAEPRSASPRSPRSSRPTRAPRRDRPS